MSNQTWPTRHVLGCIFLLFGFSTVCVGAGDFGQAGIAVWRPSTGIWYVAQNGNAPVVTHQWGAAADIPVSGDFDGDGKTDFAVWRPSTGTWYIVYSSTGQLVTRQWGVPTDIPISGDFDGDGKTDFAVWRPSTGYWYITQSSDGRVVTRQWGTPTDVPAVGDFDRDGKTDIAVFRPSTGYWYILQSSNNQTVAKQWGQPGDRPVPADYDGSGEANIAVFRPSNGDWYILQSDGEVVVRQWGESGDVPVRGDYDGDGIADLAVWRPSTGYWYIIQSSNDQVVTHQWGASSDVPVANFVSVPGVGPTIAGVGPNSVNAGSTGFQMAILGSNFDEYSTVQWNGSPRYTIFFSSTELLATVTPADVATQGPASITVVNFDDAATVVSNAKPFTVSAATAAASITPLVQSISVSGGPGNGGFAPIYHAFTISVNGPTNSTYYYKASFTGTAVTSLEFDGGTTTYGTTVPAGPVAGRISGEPSPGEGGTVTGSFTGPTLLNGGEVFLQSGATLGSGTFTDTIVVTVCADPQCANPLPGSPFMIPVTLTVTGNALPDTQFQLTNAINFEALSTSSTPPVSTTLISTTSLPPNGAYVFTTLGSGGALQSAAVQSNLDGTATLTVTGKPPTQLGIGTHADTLKVNICFDAACHQQAPNFPVTIPITYLVDATAGTDFNIATTTQLQISGMAWDPVTQRIYVTAASDEGYLNNALVVINPTTAAFEHIVSLGQNIYPNGISISDDGAYAYITENNAANSVLRVNLITLSVDESVPVPSIVEELKVVPGQAGSFAVTTDVANYTKLQIFDGVTARPQSFTSHSLEGTLDFVWGEDANTLYVWDNLALTLDRFSVSSSGLALAQEVPGVTLADGMQYLQGFIYLQSGAVYDTATNTFAPPFSPLNENSNYYPFSSTDALDSALNRAYFLTDDSQSPTNNQSTLQGFNLTTRESIWLARVPPGQGPIIRWGTNGLAYVGSFPGAVNNVTLISGPIVTR